MKSKLILLLMFIPLLVEANKLEITNVQVLGHKRLSFSISWDNSWNLEGLGAPYNHDAVWVFVKFAEGKGEWHHLFLSNLTSDHSAGGNILEVKAVDDHLGVLVKRKDRGEGNIPATTIELAFRDSLPSGNYAFLVAGIEMVFIPEGEFYLGDTSSMYTFMRGDQNLPYKVSSEDVIRLGTQAHELRDTGTFAAAGDIPSLYPKGHAAFYMMKYEITQQQYVDFLNTLTFSQQQGRTVQPPSSVAGTFAMSPTAAKVFRNGIVIELPGNAPGVPAVYAMNANEDAVFGGNDDGGHRACNFLNWNDVMAYLAWSGLRPMTELEFEKASRGPVYPVPGEFAWGTPEAVAGLTVVNDGTPLEKTIETATSTGGLANWRYHPFGDEVKGPFRSGFGGSDTSGRLQAGASWYGVMELSGNVWEMCVTVNAHGLQFTGNSGNGTLAANGDAAMPGWEVAGGGLRGGAWNSGIFLHFRDFAVSDRNYADVSPTQRLNTSGGRGVR